MKRKPLSIAYGGLAIILFVILFTTFTYYRNYQKTMPTSEQGYVDLTDWDFVEQGTVKLDGYWEFYPNRLLTPDEMVRPDLTPDLYIRVPRGWSYEDTKEQMQDKGIGTYRLRVKMTPESALYGIKTTYIRNSSKIFVNGVEVGHSGTPAPSDEDGYVSRNIPYTVFFPVEEDEFIIAVQVANLDYSYGGIIQSIHLGTQQHIADQKFKMSFLDTMGISFLLLSSIYYLGIYLKRLHDKSFLYFTIFCFAYTFIVSSSNERLFMQIFPEIPYMLVIRIKFAAIGLGITCICLFVREMGRVFLPTFLMNLVIASMIAISIVGFVLPGEWFSYAENALVAVTVMVFILMLSFIFRAYMQQQYGKLNRVSTRLLMVVITLLLVQFATMILYLYSFVNTNIVPIMTLLLFLLCIAAMFAEQYQKAYDDLEMVGLKLIEADKLKDEFLINTSHEFKTPLHGIMNLAHVVMEQNQTTLADKHRENLSYIISLATRLSTLVNDIIDFQNLRNSTLVFQNKIFDVNSIVQATMEVFQYMRKSEEVRLVNKIPDGTYFLNTDQNRFKQIVVNLVGNALKYTDQGVVEVAAISRDGAIYITFSDTGYGISEELQKQLFHGDILANTMADSEYTSSGLGLKIAKLLSSHMGGELYLKWSKLGEGSVFELKLPEADGRQHGAMPEKRQQNAKNDQEPSVVNGDSPQLRKAKEPIQGRYGPAYSGRIDDSEPVGSPSITPAEQIKILVVDDEASNVKVLQELFGTDRYHTLVAYDGSSALKMIEQHKDLSLVLLDVMLPGGSGYEVCRRIRQDYPIYELPILLLTVRNSAADIATGLGAGANDFLVKPFDSRELMARVNTLLQMKEAVKNALKMETLFLQSQIKPHFIYNVLSIIISLCYSDAERAGKLLGEFSNYLRLSFDLDPQHSMVSFRRELSLVRSYIDLEQARFGERLQVNMDIDREAMDVSVPALIIQPLVENAIRHGLMKRIAGGAVHITARRISEELQVVIQDNGMGISEEMLETILQPGYSDGSVGLINVNKRLTNEYGKGLLLSSKEGEGTTVKVTIPIRIGADS